MKLSLSKSVFLLVAVAILLLVATLFYGRSQFGDFWNFDTKRDTRYLLDSIPISDGRIVYRFEYPKMNGSPVTSFVAIDSSLCSIGDTDLLIKGENIHSMEYLGDTLVIYADSPFFVKEYRNASPIPVRIERCEVENIYRKSSLREGVFFKDICDK